MRSGRPRAAWPSIGSFSLAAVVVAASLGGVLLPSTYARETPSWRAQGIGQDWFDLLVLAPALVASGTRALGGSRTARMVLGGALVYALYSFALYAFAVHFNALFLVYCVGLGISFFTLAGLLAAVLREEPQTWLDDDAPVRIAGGFLVGVGSLFAALWLSEIVPALARGTVPVNLAEAGLVTNPVHVLDLSLVIPAVVASGASLARRRRLGCALGPMMLAFNAFMLLAIVAKLFSMRASGVPSDLGPALALGAIAAASVALLVALARRLRRGGPARGAADDASRAVPAR